MLYLRFSFQFLQFYSSWRLGMLVLTIHICNARWASSPCSSRNYSYPPVSLPLLHKRGVSEQKLCSRFLSRMFTLPKVGPVVTMEYFQATATPPQTGSCLDAASKNLCFHQFFFPLFTPCLFFWLSLTHVQFSRSIYFFNKGLEQIPLSPEDAFRDASWCFPQVVSSYLWE